MNEEEIIYALEIENAYYRELFRWMEQEAFGPEQFNKIIKEFKKDHKVN